MIFPLVMLLLALGRPAAGPAVTVSAAVSLTDVLQEIAEAWRRAGGDEVHFNFAASNVLARQIAKGAPVDLFISADAAQMDYVQARGGIDGRTRVDVVTNRLAVVVPATTQPAIRTVEQLTARSVRRLAVGDPAAVPAGVYAKAYLQKAGLWSGVERKLLALGSVRAALAAVASGGADAAFVYESDVAASPRVALAFVVGGPDAPRIVYPAAVTASSKNPDAARRFLAFLRGDAAARIFARYKFSRAE